MLIVQKNNFPSSPIKATSHLSKTPQTLACPKTQFWASWQESSGQVLWAAFFLSLNSQSDGNRPNRWLLCTASRQSPLTLIRTQFKSRPWGPIRLATLERQNAIEISSWKERIRQNSPCKALLTLKKFASITKDAKLTFKKKLKAVMVRRLGYED